MCVPSAGDAKEVNISELPDFSVVLERPAAEDSKSNSFLSPSDDLQLRAKAFSLPGGSQLYL